MIKTFDHAPSSKCTLSYGTFPPFIDPNQPPTKKKPFSTLMNQSFNHTIDLVLPSELYDVIRSDLEAKLPPLSYSRVIMPISALLEGDFFTEYIKTGNIMMLSEGRPDIDDTYSLKDGILRLQLAKETYERTGLRGKPIGDLGRKHLKTRFLIELNLRLPSMVRGKKLFDRLVWASMNVLNQSVTWLFHDFNAPVTTTISSTTDPLQTPKTPLSPHHPLTHTLSPTTTPLSAVKVPPLTASALQSWDDDQALDIQEWLAMVALHSPRILRDDVIDPLLSRYEVPDADQAATYDLVHVRWRGFIPGDWVRGLLISLCKSKTKLIESRGWWALSAYAFATEALGGREGCTVLKLASDGDAEGEEDGGRYVLWEMER